MTGLDSDALLPCPFCGGDADVRSKMVGCFNMECWGPAIMHFATISEATAAWNHRAALTPAPVKLADLDRMNEVIDAKFTGAPVPGWNDALEAATKRATAIAHWVTSADGTPRERSMADEIINKIGDPTFMPLPRALKHGSK